MVETLRSVNQKIKQVNANTDIRELERIIDEMNENKEIMRDNIEEVNEVMNQANEGDPDISEEFKQLEAEMNKDIPKANAEQLVNDNKQANKEPAENLVFL